MEKKFVYVYDVVEHERGLGIRPDGYMVFIDQETAEKWREDKYKSRTGSAPECYDTYEGGSWQPIHESIYNKVKADKHLWVRSLNDIIKATKTRKVQLVWTLELEEEDQKLTDDELYLKYFMDLVPFGEITIK